LFDPGVVCGNVAVKLGRHKRLGLQRDMSLDKDASRHGNNRPRSNGLVAVPRDRPA
jgi:hypothetical protein